MKYVRNLSRLRRTCPHGSGIIPSPIATDQGDFWMQAHPDGRSLDSAIGHYEGFPLKMRENRRGSMRKTAPNNKEIDNFLAHYLDKNGAVLVSLPKGNVINTKL
jgi:hypothetical protein